MKSLKPKIIIARDGSKLYFCPRCGHVFKNNKLYVKHLFKSHFHLIKKEKESNE